MADSKPTPSSTDNSKPSPAAKPSVADVLPAVGGATGGGNIAPAGAPPSAAPPPKTLNQQAGDAAEEKENGLAKLAKNSMSPYILMGLLAAGSMMGAPMWMIVAGGLIGWAMIAAGRNSDSKPHGNGDVAVMGAPNQGQVQAQGRGQNLDVAVNLQGNMQGNNVQSSNDVAVNLAGNNLQTPAQPVPPAQQMPIVPKLNGVERDKSNNDVVLPPSTSPTTSCPSKQNSLAVGF